MEGWCKELVEDDEFDRERCGDVWVAADRWKNSLAAMSSLSSAEESSVDLGTSGETETTSSNFSCRFCRFSRALSAKE